MIRDCSDEYDESPMMSGLWMTSYCGQLERFLPHCGFMFPSHYALPTLLSWNILPINHMRNLVGR